ncbi:LysR substrate-binding domain-containing protein [uncultured Tateyamaria sp.]|uniref:LysR substrate-binding domain-containing protein n=1 Tax=uncultured Tateyamaria sp. TaxID=455651 RepID=UPI002608FC2A|nr:LysR substrate-binding domain-containing protein [uncultured Tateyamaria sp.]
MGAISQLAETREAIRDAQGGGSGFVRISVLHTISVNYLANRIENMQRDIPGLRTRVVSDSLSTCCELLVEGAVDIMLCYYHASVSPRIDDAVFTRKNLLTERLIPVAVDARAGKDGWNLSTNDGPPIPYLAYEQSSFLDMVVESTVGQKPMNVETIYVDGLVETIKRRLLHGSGFAWMPETAIAAELADGTLVPIGDETWCARLTIAALADPTSFAPQARELWDLL